MKKDIAYIFQAIINVYCSYLELSTISTCLTVEEKVDSPVDKENPPTVEEKVDSPVREAVETFAYNF